MANRKTVMIPARVHRPTLEAIRGAAERLGDGAQGLTVEALVAVALRHEDEVREEIQRQREAGPENRHGVHAHHLHSG